MADTPENNTDQLLKACARQRREEAGPPLEMPEATRRVLQAEVTRTFPKSAAAKPPAWLRWFAGFWPRLAFASGLAVLVVVLALVTPRTGQEKLPPSFELAKNAGQEPLTAPPQTAPAAPPQASEPMPVLSQNSVATPPAAPSQTIERELMQEPAVAQESLARLSENTAPLTLKPAPPADSLSLSRARQPGGFTGENLQAAEGLARKGAPALKAAASQIADATPSPAPTLPLAATAGAAQSLDGAGDKAIPGRKVEERSALLADNKTAADRAAKGATAEPSGSEAVLVARAPEAPAAIVSNAAQPSYFQTDPARGLTEQEAGWPRLQFSQIDTRARLRSNRNSPPPITNVLNSFQVQRQGSNILVFDADGSVYEGTVQVWMQGVAATSAVASREAPARGVPVQSRFQNNADLFQKQTAPTPNAVGIPEGANFSFSATGTNRSLNRKVVFTGQYLNFNNTNQQLRLLQNERIEGKAMIGKTEFPIEALRVAPQP